MADIFISYAREDATAARRLAAELEKRGWSVFWDRRVPAGRHFAEFISEKLAAARCVITLWSRAANASDWVQEEAEEAKKRNILVPALIEQVDPPWGFRRIQAADLLNWQGEGVHEGFQQLLKDIEQYAPSHAAVAQPEGFVGRGKETEQSWPAQPESVDVPSKTLDRSSEKPDAERQALEAGIAASLRAENARQEREQWDTGAKSDADRLTRQDPEQERREPEAERRAADRAGKEHPERGQRDVAAGIGGDRIGHGNIDKEDPVEAKGAAAPTSILSLSDPFGESQREKPAGVTILQRDAGAALTSTKLEPSVIGLGARAPLRLVLIPALMVAAGWAFGEFLMLRVLPSDPEALWVGRYTSYAEVVGTRDGPLLWTTRWAFLFLVVAFAFVAAMRYSRRSVNIRATGIVTGVWTSTSVVVAALLPYFFLSHPFHWLLAGALTGLSLRFLSESVRPKHIVVYCLCAFTGALVSMFFTSVLDRRVVGGIYHVVSEPLDFALVALVRASFESLAIFWLLWAVDLTRRVPQVSNSGRTAVTL